MRFDMTYSLDTLKKQAAYMPYIAAVIGLVFTVVGLYFASDAQEFVGRSVVTDVKVIAVESRVSKSKSSTGTRNSNTVYRTTFEAQRPDGTALSYAGSTWVSPKPHDEGEIVEGRVDWATGEIVSTKLLRFAITIGRISIGVGLVA